jgi:hypothetical protein
VTVLTTERKVDEVQRRLLLDCLKPVHSATHDSSEAVPPCLKNTRTQLLAEVATWMTSPSTRPVFWLKGVAGTGKSAIARSVATYAKDQQCLLGSFFFSRMGSTDRRTGSTVVPTIVYQLALTHGFFCSRLCSIIQSEPDIRWKPTDTQVKALVSDAFKDLPHAFSRPLLVVIDALDECERKDDQAGGSLIPDLIGAFQELPFPVKMFVTSRPASSIENLFSQANFRGITVEVALHRDIDQDVVRDDIGHYLRHQFDQLALKRSIPLPPPFPLETEFVDLMNRAGNLFIYARTVVQYVSRPAPSPRHQLKLLLSGDSRIVSRGFRDLDLLYRHILMEAFDACDMDGIERHRVRDVLASLVVLQENLLMVTVAALNSIDGEDCKTIFRSLSSVVLYDDKSREPVRMIHPSFPDFLTDQKRCVDVVYAVDISTHHLRLAECCLQTLNQNLRRNILDIADPFLPNCDNPGLQQRLSSRASAQLRYACKFWLAHVRHADGALSSLIPSLTTFCENHLPHWVELLSLMDELPSAIKRMSSTLNHLQVRLYVQLMMIIAQSLCPGI